MKFLGSGKSGAMIVRQGDRIVPVDFDDIMDPKTRRTRSGVWWTSRRQSTRWLATI